MLFGSNVARAREEGSAGQGKLGAPLDRGRVGGLVAALLGGTLVEVVMTSQPSGRTVAHPLGDKGHVVLVGRRGCMEPHAAVVGLDEDPIGTERM